MFAKLPKHIQNRIEQYLNVNNFAAAKAVYDDWVSRRNCCA